MRLMLQFNEQDVRHKRAYDILKKSPRHCADLVTSAVLHYVECPDAHMELDAVSLRSMIRSVITEMLADGTLQVSAQMAAPTNNWQKEAESEDSSLGSLMDAFR